MIPIKSCTLYPPHLDRTPSDLSSLRLKSAIRDEKHTAQVNCGQIKVIKMNIKGKEKKLQEGGNQEDKKRYQVVLVADDCDGSLRRFDSETPIVDCVQKVFPRSDRSTYFGLHS
jgi:hypothetical protein